MRNATPARESVWRTAQLDVRRAFRFFHDREIIEGYERIPETDEEIEAAKRSARRMIEEEPW